jgi:hypothetical protein
MPDAWSRYRAAQVRQPLHNRVAAGPRYALAPDSAITEFMDRGNDALDLESMLHTRTAVSVE